MEFDNTRATPTPTSASLLSCTIAGVPFQRVENGSLINYFHVQELRIYEDNCKFYFTGQLVIEVHQNVSETFLSPQADVVISFTAPPNTKVYMERFKVYSYESKPREGDLNNSMVITISLIGEEYYKDKSSQVQRNIIGQTAVSAAAEIHREYLRTNGSLRTTESLGMIGQQLHAHQVLSKQPSKAIHDLLDKAIFPVNSFGPGVYFRNYPGYVIAPLEQLIRSAPVRGRFRHFPAGSAEIGSTLAGYDLVIHFRPMSPPGEDRGGARAIEADGANKVAGWLDFAAGNSQTAKGSGGSGYGSGVIKNVIDSFRQLPMVDKQGPGNYQSRENAFISQLTYSPKYWTSVPLQTGIDVTVGDRITVIYPVASEIRIKTMWVARLIHEVRFTEGKTRNVVSVNGTTDLFGVEFKG